MTAARSFPCPTRDDLDALTAFRHELHRYPEISGEERETAARVRDMLEGCAPDRILTDLGGHGLAAVYDSGIAGPTILFRSELDALPIHELGEAAHRSTVPGKGHMCGHDGHSTILLGLARILAHHRPAKGRVVLLFQPAEETGMGAAAVIADPRFAEIRPDWAFSLHNAPEVPFGMGMLGAGPANCASRGMWIELTGSTAHASRPQDGLSPMRAMAELMPALEGLGAGLPLGPGFTLVTLTHAMLGAPTYGVAPGTARIQATLRTIADAEMTDLMARAEVLIGEAAARHGLALSFGYEDVFRACTNDPDAVSCLARGMDRAGIGLQPMPVPWVASEDFGQFGLAGAKSAMVFLGSGPDWPALHTPTYDFRDALIGQGIRLFGETLGACLETN